MFMYINRFYLMYQKKKRLSFLNEIWSIWLQIILYDFFHLGIFLFANIYFLALSEFSLVAQSCPTLQPHGLQHARPSCPSPTPRVYSNSCPLSQWCHPNVSSSVIPFSHLQSFPASGSFPMNQFFASGGQSIGVSASSSILPMNIQDWFPLGLTGWIFLLSKELSRVFSNSTVQKHQFSGALAFFIVQLSHPYVTTGKNIALTRQTFAGH